MFSKVYGLAHFILSNFLIMFIVFLSHIDYDEKAEDAVDYEDFDEQYEGPEVQAATEEDYLLPKKAYISNSLATLKPTASVFDDENYDEEIEEEQEVVDNDSKVQNTLLGRLG